MLYQAINEQAIISLPKQTGVSMNDKFRLEHDISADVQADYEARLEAAMLDIRATLKVEDHIREIECDASFDLKIDKLYRNLFLGGEGDLLARAMQQFADNWLDEHAMSIAKQVVAK